MQLYRERTCEAVMMFATSRPGDRGHCACELGDAVGEYMGKKLCFVHLARARAGKVVVLKDGTRLGPQSTVGRESATDPMV